ncbi:hypothetical protein HAX54_042978 [Datura stramonium]|uniref:Uncharacterized protein n=1 Tax=Datura stramonium TaxID=4076 RepID=A0ABS8SMI4_DATST|nr:hypothetical protein [Datura stramonium]
MRNKYQPSVMSLGLCQTQGPEQAIVKSRALTQIKKRKCRYQVLCGFNRSSAACLEVLMGHTSSLRGVLACDWREVARFTILLTKKAMIKFPESFLTTPSMPDLPSLALMLSAVFTLTGPVGVLGQQTSRRPDTLSLYR